MVHEDEYSTDSSSGSSDEEPVEENVPLIQWGTKRRRTGAADQLLLRSLPLLQPRLPRKLQLKSRNMVK
jgi:hypothetical protein